MNYARLETRLVNRERCWWPRISSLALCVNNCCVELQQILIDWFMYVHIRYLMGALCFSPVQVLMGKAWFDHKSKLIYFKLIIKKSIHISKNLIKNYRNSTMHNSTYIIYRSKDTQQFKSILFEYCFNRLCSYNILYIFIV